MYVYDFLKEENIFNLNFKTTTTNDKINFYEIQEKILEKFEIPKYLLHKDSYENNTIFIGQEHENLSLNNLKNVVENQMISFYIDALSEEPKT